MQTDGVLSALRHGGDHRRSHPGILAPGGPGISLNGFLLLFCAGCLLSGFLVTCVNIPISTALMRVVDRDKLSKVSSIVSILAQGLVPIAAVLAGIVIQCWGCTLLLVICSAGFAAAALFLLFNRNVREI